MAKKAMRAARENENKAAEASGVSNTLETNLGYGLTIDLSRKKIRELPEEIVDVIKDELERYGSLPVLS
jgi:hypothetical protein